MSGKLPPEDEMYAAHMASDPSYNGKFVVGVLSTGIYCLPSCHARKPKRENVRFFATFDEARAARLRACLKCKPYEFERGEDRELERLEATVAELRADPSQVTGVAELAERIGWGATKLQDNVRRHYHRTAADLILEAKITRAQNLLATTDIAVTQVGFDAGFDAISSFNARFLEATGLTPSAYRALPSSECFTLRLPSGANLDPLFSRLDRDADGVIESFEGKVYRRALHIDGQPSILEVQIDKTLHVRVFPAANPAGMFEAHAMVTRMFGLGQDPRGFEAHCTRIEAAKLVGTRSGARIPQTPTVFDGFIWAIVGQQVNLTFARTMRRRLAESFGDAVDGMRTLPSAAKLASLEVEDLLPLQFSRRKAEYLIGIARLSESGFEELRDLSATRVEAALMALRGLGAWSTNYLMMRALGFADCLPVGDTGLASGLKGHFALDHSPKQPEQLELMACFSPYRSLATYHLWQSLKDSA